MTEPHGYPPEPGSSPGGPVDRFAHLFGPLGAAPPTLVEECQRRTTAAIQGGTWGEVADWLTGIADGLDVGPDLDAGTRGSITTLLRMAGEARARCVRLQQIAAG